MSICKRKDSILFAKRKQIIFFLLVFFCLLPLASQTIERDTSGLEQSLARLEPKNIPQALFDRTSLDGTISLRERVSQTYQNLPFLASGWMYSQNVTTKEGTQRIRCEGRTIFQAPNLFRISSDCEQIGRDVPGGKKQSSLLAISDGTNLLLFHKQTREFIYTTAPDRFLPAKLLSPHTMVFSGDVQIKLLQKRLSSDGFMGNLLSHLKEKPLDFGEKPTNFQSYTNSIAPFVEDSLGRVENFDSKIEVGKDLPLVRSLKMNIDYATPTGDKLNSKVEYFAEFRQDKPPLPSEFWFELPLDVKQVDVFTRP